MVKKRSRTPKEFVEQMHQAGFEVKPVDLSGIRLDPSAGRPLFDTVLLDSMFFRAFMRACVDDGFIPRQLVPKPYLQKTVGYRTTRDLCLQALTLFDTPIFYISMEEMDLITGNDPIAHDPFKMLEFMGDKLGVPWVMGSGFMSSIPFDSDQWLDVELDMPTILPFLPFTIEWLKRYDPFYRRIPTQGIEALVFIFATHRRDRAISETVKCFPDLSRIQAKTFLRDTISRISWYANKHALYMKEATKHEATPYFCMHAPKTTMLGASKKETQIFKLALSSIGARGLRVPEITTLDMVRSLRDDVNIVAFRKKLGEWIDLVGSGDRAAIEEIGHQVDEAQRKMQKLGKMSTVGEVLTYIALPVGFAELLIQVPVVSMCLSAIGVGLNLSAARLRSELGWMRFLTGS